MSDVLFKAMAKARGFWLDGRYQKSAEVMQCLGISDLPPQVTSYLEVLELSGAQQPAASYIQSLEWFAQAQHNKLMANFFAEENHDPNGLLTALQALDKVSACCVLELLIYRCPSCLV